MVSPSSTLPAGCERVPIGALSLNVRITGSGDDTVYLFHGVTANLHVWKPVADQLSHSYRVIAVDQRGHGHSDKPKFGYTASDFADDVIGLVDELGGKGLNVLVGHSLGSRNAVVATSKRPESIDGFVGIDFTPYIESDIFDALEARVTGGDRTFQSRSEIESYLAGRYPLMPADAVARRAAYGYSQTTDGLRALASARGMRQTVAGLREDLSAHVSPLRKPGLFVRGAQSALVTPAAFESTRRLRPDLKYVLVAEADHYVPEEQPTEIVRIVTEFAESLRGRGAAPTERNPSWDSI